MQKNIEIDPEIADILSVFQDSPKRDPQKAANGRAAFLAQAKEMAATLPQPVTARNKHRLNRWKQALQSFFVIARKERSPMFSTFGTILLVFALMFGGGGATVAAAQGSLPDQALYPVKTWTEAVRYQLAEKEQTQLKLALEFANRRGEEVQAMMRAGDIPSEPVQTRLQAQFDLALKLAAGQPDDKAGPALQQVREQLQKQEQAFLRLGPQSNPINEAIRLRTQTMLQERLQLCDEGLKDPAMLREQLKLREQAGEPKPENSVGPGSNNKEAGFGPGPYAGPSDGGYGPGDGTCDDCEGGYGPGPGTGTGTGDGSYGPGPGAGTGTGEGSEGPGCSGYGPGDGTCDGTGSGYTGGDNSGPGTTGGDNSGSGSTGGDSTGGDNSGAGSTGGDNSGSTTGGTGGSDAGGGGTSGGDSGGGSGGGGH